MGGRRADLRPSRLVAAIVARLRFGYFPILGLGHLHQAGSLHHALGMPGENSEAIGSKAEATYFSTDQFAHIGTPSVPSPHEQATLGPRKEFGRSNLPGPEPTGRDGCSG